MKTTYKRLLALFLLLSLLLSSVSTAFADDDDWYTYTYSYWGDEMASPNAYAVTNNIYLQDLDSELGGFSNAQGIFTIDDLVFVCDTNNNRIVELVRREGKYELVRVIYTVAVSTLVADQMKFGDAVDNTLFAPTDIFVKHIDDDIREKLYPESKYIGTPYEFPDTPATPAADTEKKDDAQSADTPADAQTPDDGAATTSSEEDGETGETGET